MLGHNLFCLCPTVLLLVAGVSCGEAREPHDANGATPIRYVSCGRPPLEETCKVYARFSNMQHCEEYRQQQASYCDSASEQNVMTCRFKGYDVPGVVAVSYCLP